MTRSKALHRSVFAPVLLALGLVMVLVGFVNARAEAGGLGLCPGDDWIKVIDASGSGIFDTTVHDSLNDVDVRVFSTDGFTAQFSSPIANVTGFSVKGGVSGGVVRNTETYDPAVASGSVESTPNKNGETTNISNVCIRFGVVTTTTTAATTTTTATTPTTAAAAAVAGVTVTTAPPRAAPEALAFTGNSDAVYWLTVVGAALMALGFALYHYERRLVPERARRR